MEDLTLTRRQAEWVLAAIRRGDVPGIGDHLFTGRVLVPKLEQQIAAQAKRIGELEAARNERQQALEREYNCTLLERKMRVEAQTERGATRSALMEERNHREKSDNIAREAARQRDEARARVAELERQLDATRAATERSAMGLHVKEVEAELAALKARKVDLRKLDRHENVNGTLHTSKNGPWVLIGRVAEEIRAAGIEVADE